MRYPYAREPGDCLKSAEEVSVRPRRMHLFFIVLQVLFISGVFLAPAQDEKISGWDKSEAKAMLRVVRDDIKSHYYSSNFNGLDLDARFREAEQKIDSSSTMNYALAAVAGAMSALNDSHTFFMPPPRPYRHDYGWRMQAIGESACFITAVRPGSDAESKGLKPGDEVLRVNGYEAIREDIWKINYVFGVLRPQPGLRLVVRSPDGNTRQVDAMAAMRRDKQLMSPLDVLAEMSTRPIRRSRFVEYGKAAVLWSLPDFLFNPEEANQMLDRMNSHDAVVMDLRGNPGGSVKFLSDLLGGFFEKEVKIADRAGRKNMKPEVTKPRHGKTFSGKLVVLVDSDSGSAAEIFARVVQLEKRGTVVGDRSAGSVMESEHYEHKIGEMVATFYATSITEANLIMADGKSLEHSGVIPDERVLPTAADLAAGRDPALARAASLVGVKLTPEQAAKLFPMEWPRD